MDGFTYGIPYTNILFMNVSSQNNLQTLMTSIHEFAHAIAFLINKEHSWDANKYNFCEIESLFMELLAYDFISEKLDMKLDAYKMKVREYNDNLFYNRIVCGKLDIYSQLKEKELNSKRAIRKYILSNTNLLKQDINEICYSLIENKAYYVISYLTAIELYLKNKIDHNTSIEMLKDIIKLKNMNADDYLKVLTNIGINPGNSIEVYRESLIEEGGSLHESKKIFHRC